MNIYLIGYMAVGKTTIAKKLAAKMGMIRIDLDARIEESAGKTIEEIFAVFGEDHFRQLEKEALQQTFSEDNCIISTGGGTPCFYNNMEQIKKNGISIWIRLSPEMIVQRLLYAKTLRPLVKDKTKEEILNHTREMLEKRQPYYEQADIYTGRVSNSKTLNNLILQIEAKLKTPRP